MEIEEIKTNKHGTNLEIKFNVLPDEEMRKLGFTDYRKDHWYLCEQVDSECDISFNVTIDKNKPNGGDSYIDVIDEDFLQPYDYQHILESNPNHSFANHVRNIVEKYMARLKDSGVISGHNYGDYI